MPILEQLREKIEEIDADIIKKLAEREELSKQIGQLKWHEGKDIIDFLREEKLFEFYENVAKKHKVQQNFVKRLFKIIIAHSRIIQKTQ